MSAKGIICRACRRDCTTAAGTELRALGGCFTGAVTDADKLCSGKPDPSHHIQHNELLIHLVDSRARPLWQLVKSLTCDTGHTGSLDGDSHLTLCTQKCCQHRQHCLPDQILQIQGSASRLCGTSALLKVLAAAKTSGAGVCKTSAAQSCVSQPITGRATPRKTLDRHRAPL